MDDLLIQDDEAAEDIDVGAEKAELTQLADEYSKMDAEDVVGGVRTRFRYREVRMTQTKVNLCHYDCLRPLFAAAFW